MTNTVIKKLELLTLLIITLLGIFQGQVTVFYIIYLFWFQELIRSLIDMYHLLRKPVNWEEKTRAISFSLPSYFLLFVYLVFIVVLFGVFISFKDPRAMDQNVRILTFQNPYFNANILLFTIEYLWLRHQRPPNHLHLITFNKRHIILHLSIILGAILQLIIAPRLELDEKWVSAMTVIPFLILRIVLDKSINESDQPLLR